MPFIQPLGVHGSSPRGFLSAIDNQIGSTSRILIERKKEVLI